MAARPRGYGLSADAKREMGAKYDIEQGETSTIQHDIPAKHYFSLNLKER